MKRTIHICQSVDGAIKNWKISEWKSLAKSNNCSVKEVKEYFIDLQKQGKRVIPIGEECEGFSYLTGCPGHGEIENE